MMLLLDKAKTFKHFFLVIDTLLVAILDFFFSYLIFGNLDCEKQIRIDTGSMCFVMRCAIWSFFQDMLATVCIRVKLVTKKEDDRCNNLLASKALRQNPYEKLESRRHIQWMLPTVLSKFRPR